MKVSALFTTLLATTALAAPAPEPRAEVKAMSAAQTWTIESMKRTCDAADAVCNWSFTVNAGGARQKCAYPVKKSGGKPASRSPQNGVDCGNYRVTSAWSGQFGEGQGFTTLSVVKNQKLIVWPAYTDKQLAGGKVVKPDQSYPVQNLPL
jgi:hypothetical protein